MPSGAFHDANPMAQAGVPIGMIFVPSVKGISHQGEEYTAPHHVDLGADVLYETVLELDEKGLEHVHIQVDGGINRATIDEVLAAGANIIVAGSAVFGSNIEQNVRELQEKISSYSDISPIIVAAKSDMFLFPKYDNGNFFNLLAISTLTFALSL